jgi:hypothetical protein
MARDLLLPSGMVPTNLHLRDSVKTRYVDSDLYGICERMKHISPSLYAVELEEGRDHAYAIMERCIDGIDRLVFKVRELDARVLNKLEYLMAKPLQERLEIIERDEHKYEEDRKEAELEQLYETMGAPMLRDLDRLGFLKAPRGTSYAKKGVYANRRTR